MDRADLVRSTRRVLNRIDLLRVSRVTPVPRTYVDEIDALLATLPRVEGVIAVFLRRNKLQGKGGNHDPLTRVFIDQVFHLWCELHWAEVSPDENRMFVGLLAAAWRDFNFPTRDGQSLEEWLTDRVRKQFPDGPSRTRSQDQYEELLNAYEN